MSYTQLLTPISQNWTWMTKILSICLLLLFVSCKGSSTHTAEKENIAYNYPTNSDSLNTIYFGFITRYNPRIMYQEYQPIMDYLSSKTPYHFEILLGKTYLDAVDHLKRDLVQISSFGAVTYIEADAKFNVMPILKPLNENGTAYYKSLIVVRDDSEIQQIADLHGRSFAFASHHSTSGYLIPSYELLKNGIPLEDLSDYSNLKHHDSVAKAVLSGEYDAGAVKDIIGLRYLEKGLRVIHKSNPIPSVPLVVKENLDVEIISAIKAALLSIDINNRENAKIIQNWNSEFKYGFTEAKDSDYHQIREMINGVPETCGNGCHPGN